jgi:hypothetical protein
VANIFAGFSYVGALWLLLCVVESPCFSSATSLRVLLHCIPSDVWAVGKIQELL